MPKRSMEQAWKVALATVALLATAMALYVQLFERRPRQEEDRLAALRLEEALAESQVRLKAEILAQLRADLAKGTSTQQGGDQPLPNAVLRRGESGTGSTLQQFVGPPDSQLLLVRLQESLDTVSSQMEESDRALRRDLDAWRAHVQRELDASSKVLTLLLIALIPLVAHFLFSLWQPRRWRREEEGAERQA